MTTVLSDCLVDEGGSIRDAMLALDRGAVRIALATDADGRIVGVATDGDVRRALLGGASLDSPVRSILTRSFASASPTDGRSDVLDLMRARGVNSVPVVDADGRPVGLHLLHAFIEPAVRPNRALIMAGYDVWNGKLEVQAGTPGALAAALKPSQSSTKAIAAR